MKKTKRFVAAILSVVMTFTATLAAVIIPVAADTSADSNLLFHYDFEETGDGVFANKAPRENGASKDALILSSADSEAATVANGTVTSNWDSFAMRVAPSENTKAIQTAENNTWFFRFKVPTLDSNANAGKEVIIDFRNRSISARPLWIAAKWQTLTPDVQINGSVAAGKVGESGHDWIPNEWMNLAVVRKGTTSTVYYISGDGATVTRMYTSTSAVVEAEGFGFSFFREWNEANTKYETYTYAQGMSYDDIRCYTDALSEDELKGIVAELLQPATPPEEDSTDESTEDPVESNAPSNENTEETDHNDTVETNKAPTSTKEEPTEAPTTEESAEQTTQAADSGDTAGCGAAMGGTVLGILLLVGTAWVPFSKRR